MTRLARAFLAVVPPDPVLDAVDARLELLRATEPSIRWLPRNQWHLTVQFLGAVADADALANAIRDAIQPVSPFTVRLAGAGAFPTPRRAAVTWIGVEDPAPLERLVAVVQAAAAALGHSPESGPYRPHLTVGRLARPRSLTRPFDAFGATPVGPAWTVGELALVESDTRPDGAVYTVRARLPFGA